MRANFRIAPVLENRNTNKPEKHGKPGKLRESEKLSKF